MDGDYFQDFGCNICDKVIVGQSEVNDSKLGTTGIEIIDQLVDKKINYYTEVETSLTHMLRSLFRFFQLFSILCIVSTLSGINSYILAIALITIWTVNVLVSEPSKKKCLMVSEILTDSLIVIFIAAEVIVTNVWIFETYLQIIKITSMLLFLIILVPKYFSPILGMDVMQQLLLSNSFDYRGGRDEKANFCAINAGCFTIALILGATALHLWVFFKPYLTYSYVKPDMMIACLFFLIWAIFEGLSIVKSSRRYKIIPFAMVLASYILLILDAKEKYDVSEFIRKYSLSITAIYLYLSLVQCSHKNLPQHYVYRKREDCICINYLLYSFDGVKLFLYWYVPLVHCLRTGINYYSQKTSLTFQQSAFVEEVGYLNSAHIVWTEFEKPTQSYKYAGTRIKNFFSVMGGLTVVCLFLFLPLFIYSSFDGNSLIVKQKVEGLWVKILSVGDLYVDMNKGNENGYTFFKDFACKDRNFLSSSGPQLSELNVALNSAEGQLSKVSALFNVNATGDREVTLKLPKEVLIAGYFGTTVSIESYQSVVVLSDSKGFCYIQSSKDVKIVVKVEPFVDISWRLGGFTLAAVYYYMLFTCEGLFRSSYLTLLAYNAIGSYYELRPELMLKLYIWIQRLRSECATNPEKEEKNLHMEARLTAFLMSLYKIPGKRQQAMKYYKEKVEQQKPKKIYCDECSDQESLVL